MAKAVKMKDIAERLNVSTMTISKALSGKPGVSDSLRERIRMLAMEMGYVSPGAPKDLYYTFGVIIESHYIEKCDTFYWKLYQEINMRASRQNCFILLGIVEDASRENLEIPKIVKENKVDGLLILGGMERYYLEVLVASAGVPIVYIDFYDEQIFEDSVISNGFYGSYCMTNYLFDRGHREIAFVGTLFSSKNITDRFLGYEKSMLEHGEAVREEWVIPDRDGEKNLYDIIVLPDQMPTAFVCNCDQTACRLIGELQRNGYDVPGDISVVGYDDYLHPGLCNVEITSYGVDMGQMAALGINLLIRKIQGKTYRKGFHIVEGYFVERESAASRETEII